MQRLAKIGFTQSYTYFTWRNTQCELSEYFTELTHAAGRRLLPAERVAEHARHPHRDAAARDARGTFIAAPVLAADAVGAATASTARRSSCSERTPREPGSRGVPRLREVPDPALGHRPARQPAPLPRPAQRDPARPPRAAAQRHAALPPTSTTTSCCAGRKTRRGDRCIVLVSSSTSTPRHVQSGWTALDLVAPRRRLGTTPFVVHDLLTGVAYTGSGPHNFVRLDPAAVPAHVFARRARTGRRSTADTVTRASSPASALHSDATDPADRRDPTWYRDAVIYELHVRAFADSDGDGIGDFRGLTRKLDYLQDLGVTAIWLLPFYPSPLRDDGYDIADYRGVNPTYGDAARRSGGSSTRRTARDLRVITELVLNHTSDQHPWFQRARRAPPGSRVARLLRVERHARHATATRGSSSRTSRRPTGRGTRRRAVLLAPLLLPPARPQLRQPRGPREMLRTSSTTGSRWASTGCASTRCRTCSSARARTARTCPRRTTFLQELRAHDRRALPGPDAAGRGEPVARGRGRLLRRRRRVPHGVPLPADAAAVHGACAWRTGSRSSTSSQPDARHRPTAASGRMFLRNHDELTLEMVTDEERDYMYRAYAARSRRRGSTSASAAGSRRCCRTTAARSS